MVRVVSSVIFFLAVPLLPWWLALVLMAGLILSLESYETVLAGVLYDGLYAVPGAALLALPLLHTVIFTATALGVAMLRRRLRIE